MPLYDFKCTNCDHVFEEQMKLAELDETCGTTECPECHMPATCTVSNPGHYKHRSWGSWNVGVK